MLNRWGMLLALVAAPVFAAQKPAFLYPLQGDGLDAAQLGEAQGLVQSALVRARDGAFSSGVEKPLAASCGPAKRAAISCLAKLAGQGVVLRGWLSRSGSQFDLYLSAIDGQQRQVGPVSARIDLTIENPEPVMAMLERLGEGLTAPLQRPPQAATPPPATPAPLTTKLEMQPKSSAVPPAATAPAPQVSGLERAGKWTAAGGLALLAGGTVVGILDRSLNSQLNDKFQQHTLTAADASSYDKVHTYNVVANTLFIAGGAAVLTGLGLWIAAPDEDEMREAARGSR
jgi:hypothetical protein